MKVKVCASFIVIEYELQCHQKVMKILRNEVVDLALQGNENSAQ